MNAEVVFEAVLPAVAAGVATAGVDPFTELELAAVIAETVDVVTVELPFLIDDVATSEVFELLVPPAGVAPIALFDGDLTIEPDAVPAAALELAGAAAALALLELVALVV